MCGIIVHDIDFDIDHTKIAGRGVELSETENGKHKLIHYRLPLQTRAGDEWKQPIDFDGGQFLYNGEIFNYPGTVYENDVDFVRFLKEVLKIKKYQLLAKKYNLEFDLSEDI